MKNNNFKNFIIFIIILPLLQEEERENDIYNLINLYNLNKMEKLIIQEKNKQVLKENIEIRERKSKQVAKESIELKKEKSKQISKEHNELKEEKEKQVSNKTIKLKNEKQKEVIKNDICNKEINNNILFKNKKCTKNLSKEKETKINKDLSNVLNEDLDESKHKKEYKIKKYIFAKVPIIVASFETEIIDRVFTKIENRFIDIKEVKNNIFIEEANLIKLNFNNAELFINGYIRSYIEYVTLDQVNKDSITTKSQGIISHKDFSKAINIKLVFFNNMKEGETFFVDFNNILKDKKALLGKIEKLDIKSSNSYKGVQIFPFQREKSYLTLEQSLLIKVKINILQKNIVFL